MTNSIWVKDTLVWWPLWCFCRCHLKISVTRFFQLRSLVKVTIQCSQRVLFLIRYNQIKLKQLWQCAILVHVWRVYSLVTRVRWWGGKSHVLSEGHDEGSILCISKPLIRLLCVFYATSLSFILFAELGAKKIKPLPLPASPVAIL